MRVYVVTDPESNEPIGVFSTWELARKYSDEVNFKYFVRYVTHGYSKIEEFDLDYEAPQ
jgi:hypothetical protein